MGGAQAIPNIQYEVLAKPDAPSAHLLGIASAPPNLHIKRSETMYYFMLKRLILLTLIIMALQVRAYEPTANNTFIDGHFIKDSVLVMASGAVYGSVMEAICYQFIQPHPRRAFYCKTFAAESLAFINLLEVQQPVWTLAICRKLNLLLVVVASGYTGSIQLGFATIRTVFASVFSYQLSRISADCAAHYYLWNPDLGNLKPVLSSYGILNGVSVGLLISGLILRYRQNLGEGIKPLVLTLASTSTTLLSTVFYMMLIESEEPFSILEIVVAGTEAGALAGALAGVLAVAAVGTEAEIIAGAEAIVGARGLALAGALTGALTVTGTIAGTIAVALVVALVEDIAGAGAIARIGAIAGAECGAAVGTIAVTVAIALTGLLIITTTRFLLRRLSNGEQPNSISRNLAQVALISVPLLVTSWLLSVNQWVMKNVSAHQTMQGIYYPVYALFSGEWIKELYHLLWLSE